MTSMGTLGEREQVWRQHQQGAVPGVMGSRPATLPPHRPSSPGTAAASEPFHVKHIWLRHGHIGKRNKAFLLGKEHLLQKHLEKGCWTNSPS